MPPHQATASQGPVPTGVPGMDDEFTFGLERVLDGVEALIRRRRRSGGRREPGARRAETRADRRGPAE
jgi:hypothetical protein